MNALFINACVREKSRTLVLAREIMKEIDGEITEVILQDEKMQPLDGKLVASRDSLIKEGNVQHPVFRYARQFADADCIIIAAPYWDLSFPALLKIYFEQICVAGITFRYDNCRPVGLCKAKKLIYVTTSGGPIVADFGYTYVKAIANGFYGIEDVVCYRAENLDIFSISADAVVNDANIVVVK